MPILIKCACGKKLSLKDELAGKKVKCPVCQKILGVPKPKASEESLDELWDSDESEFEDENEEAPAKSKNAKKTASRGAKSQKNKLKGKKSKGNPRGLLIGLATGGGVLVAALLAWMFWPAKPAENVAANPPGGDAVAKAASSATGADATTTPAASNSVPSSTPAGTSSVGSTTAAHFPRALTQPPDWLSQDTAFDVKQFWITVPPDQNAAPLYLDALYEFSHHMESCFPPEVRAQRTPAAKTRYERSEKLQIQWYNPQQAKNVVERDAVLQEHDAAFQKLMAAQQRPRCVFDIGWDVASQVPLFHAAREVIRVAGLQVERDLERGDFGSAVRMTGSMLRLSRDLRSRTPMTLQMIGDALDSMASANMVVPILKSPKLTVAQCDELLKLLVQHHAARSSINPFLTGVRGDYLAKRILLHDVQQQVGEFAEDKFRQAFGEANETRGAALLSALNGGARLLGSEPQPAMVGKMVDVFLAEMKPVHFTECEELLKKKLQVLSSGASQPYAARAAAYKAFSDELQSELKAANSGVEPPKNLTQEQQIDFVLNALRSKLAQGVKTGPMLVFLLTGKLENDIDARGDLVGSDARSRTRLQGMMALTALRRWYGTHATPPPDIATMCREAGLADVPSDAFGDASLRMVTFVAETPLQHPYSKDLKVLAGETIVYSVGPDGVDDKGLKEYGYIPNGPGDWLFRLEIPQSAIPVTPAP